MLLLKWLVTNEFIGPSYLRGKWSCCHKKAPLSGWILYGNFLSEVPTWIRSWPSKPPTKKKKKTSTVDKKKIGVECAKDCLRAEKWNRWTKSCGCLGKGNRNVFLACDVKVVRQHYLSQTGVYMGFRHG